MVMVTHDQGLRGLATKVIRLVDGKIAKQEVIGNQERQLAIEQLSRGGGTEGVGVREGGDRGL